MMLQYGSSGVFQTLIDWGFLDAILPFGLLFVLFFAVLLKVKIFDDRKINGILSFVISAMIVVPHVMGMYPADMDPINLIMAFLPQTGVLLLAILCVMMLLGIAGGGYPSWIGGLVGLIAAGLLAVVILSSIVPGFFSYLDFLSDPSLQALLIILLVMGLIGYFIIKDPSSTTTAAEPGAAIGKFLTDWMGLKK